MGDELDKTEVRPSAIEVLESCPVWINEPGGVYALRGSLIDSIITSWIRGESPKVPDEFLSHLAFAKSALRHAEGWISDGEWHTQLPVTAKSVPIKGTIDAVYMDAWELVAHLIDWKTGGSKRPHASQHGQLQAYALMLHEMFGIKTIRISLVELDLQTASEAILSGDDFEAIRQRIRNVIDKVARATLADAAPGSTQCKYCGRKTLCQALKEKAMVAVGELEQITVTPKDFVGVMTLDELGKWLDRYDNAIESAATLRGLAKQRLQGALEAGAEVSGWSLRATRKSHFWVDEDEAVALLEGHLGELAFKKKLLGVGEIRRLCKSKEVPFPEHMARTKQGRELVRLSDAATGEF